MAEDQPLANAKMARAIGDEIARRDINTIRELRLLTEIGVDQRIDARVEQKLNDWKRNNLNPELQELICLAVKEISEHSNKRFQALSEQLKTVGHYVGQWKPGQLYHRHQVVTHGGSLYFCQAESTWATPTEGEIEWQLRVRGVPDAGGDAYNGNSNGLNDLQSRLEKLEARAIPKYLGVYKPDAIYSEGSMVTRDGSVFHANKTTREQPGDGCQDWQLCVKRGERGRDAKGAT